jgi:hypothetical protein
MPFGRLLGPRPLYAKKPNLLLSATRQMMHYRSDEVVVEGAGGHDSTPDDGITTVANRLPV